ncbi:MAG: hypothetical protein HON70_20950 [Lentisphaerae bacterium]|nr:hypothetical protein [Lentisphaerota bacterium]
MTYLPQDPVLDGTVDYREQLNLALAENVCVLIPGSLNAEKPHIYGATTGVQIPAGHTLRSEANAVLKRLPSKGQLVHIGKSSRVVGVTVDGNKYGHWPEFRELGKSDSAFLLRGRCVVESCVAYDVPGIAFQCYSDHNLIRDCTARNCGYIDLRFNADYYQGKWDRWSGDGFYVRGHHNVVINCEAHDCFRWAFTTCHDNAGLATYINCRGYAHNWKPYGFIDIEGCDGGGTTMVNCVGTFGSIAISTSDTKTYGCEASQIHVYNADNVEIVGCTTHGGGIGIGGWSSVKNSTVRGGDNPVVIGNTINKYGPTPGISGVSDWSFSVFSSDGKGMVARNVLNEYDGPEGRGPGMKLDSVSSHDNVVHYGTSHVPEGVLSAKPEKTPQLRLRLRERLLQTFAAGVPGMARELGLDRKVTNVTVVNPAALFIKDLEQVGEDRDWHVPQRRPAADMLLPIRLGEHWDKQHGQYHGHAWYFATVELDQDHRFIADRAHLLFAGVDSDCRVFLNGTFIGEHSGWNEPFLLDVPMDVLRWEDQGTNALAVHVWTPAGLGGVYGHVAAVLSQKGEPQPLPTKDAQPEPTRPEMAADASSFAADFSGDSGDLGTIHMAKRAAFSGKNSPYADARLQLRGGAYALTRQSFGPGTYHVRFVLNESHEKFQYHKTSVAFYMQAPDTLPGRNDTANLHEHLSLTWRSGQVTLEYQPPPADDGKPAPRETLGVRQIPGPDSSAVQRKDQALDLTLVVPEPGGELLVYLGTDKADGESTCRFAMPEHPTAGSFGVVNHKWYSYVYVGRLAHVKP